MPAAAKTHWSQLKVGLVAIVALTILAALIVTMSGSNRLFRKTVPVKIYFDDSFAMTPGATPVRLNGIQVGKVSKIELSGDDRPNRTVRVILGINEESLPLIPVDSTAGLAQQNLLGARYINIKRGKSKTTVQPEGEIPTEDTVEITDVLNKGQDTLSTLQAILKRVESIVIQIEDGKGTIGKFLRDETLYNNLSATVDEMRKLVETVNDPNSTLGRLINDDELYKEVEGTIKDTRAAIGDGRAAVTDLRATMAKADQLITALNAGEGTAGKLLKDPALHDEVLATVRDLRQTLHLINQGDGTVTKLLKSDTLHVRLEQTMSRVDGIMDKMNSGNGTLAHLLNNPSLYESMDGTMREVQGFMKDFRKNPKKFLTIQLKLF